MNALVAGNGSYILRLNGHDLHGPTESTIIPRLCTFLVFWKKKLPLISHDWVFPNFTGHASYGKKLREYLLNRFHNNLG